MEDVNVGPFDSSSVQNQMILDTREGLHEVVSGGFGHPACADFAGSMPYERNSPMFVECSYRLQVKAFHPFLLLMSYASAA